MMKQQQSNDVRHSLCETVRVAPRMACANGRETVDSGMPRKGPERRAPQTTVVPRRNQARNAPPKMGGRLG